jgi:hypothetical protein
VVLFDGTDQSAFSQRDGSDAGWQIKDGTLEIAPGSGDLVTRERFEDVRLHLEFRLPVTADPSADEQARGNSGVYLQGRYELRILDSFGRALEGADDAAAIYGVRDAAENAALPAETWQSYDVVFRAARYRGDVELRPATLTVVWNGTLVHDQVELPDATSGGDPEAPGPAPLVLQDHAQPVRYRNVWLQRL